VSGKALAAGPLTPEKLAASALPPTRNRCPILDVAKVAKTFGIRCAETLGEFRYGRN